MGYTHDWRFKNKVAPINIANGAEKFKSASSRICEALKLITEKNGVEFAGWDGTGFPETTDTVVRFNGKDKLAYETFGIDLYDEGFDFCKTGRRPYDIGVCVALLIFKDEFGDDFIYTSDGITREAYENRDKNEYWKKIGFVPDGVEKEWEAAYDFYEKYKV